MTWHSLEPAPKDGSDVILFGQEADYVDEPPRVWIGRWSKEAWYGPAWVAFEHRTDTQYILATHWMSLPAPPEPVSQPKEPRT